MSLVSDILDEARGTYLNDPSAGTYTNDKLLPHMKSAYAFLESELEANGVQCKNEEITKIIPAGTSEYYPLPPDLVIPRSCQERMSGTTDEFREMTYRNNIPQITPSTFLTYWSWRTDRLYFLAATQDREVKLYYQRSFPAVVTSTSTVLGSKCEQFLAAKIAALAHLFLAQNTTLAQAANEIAEKELEEIIGMQVKIAQTQPIRPKPYVPYRR